IFISSYFRIRLHVNHAKHVIYLANVHAVNATGLPAHGAYFGFAEQDGLAQVTGQKDHLPAVGELHADQFIFGLETDGDDSRWARIAEFGQLGFLHGAAARGKEDVATGLFQIVRRDERGEVFVFLEFYKAADGSAARGGCRFRNFVDFEPIDPPLGAEKQDIAVGGSDQEMLDEILFARARANASLPAA